MEALIRVFGACQSCLGIYQRVAESLTERGCLRTRITYGTRITWITYGTRITRILYGTRIARII